MGKHEIQLLRVLIEGGITAYAIMLFCMEMHKLGLIYGSGWYMVWILGLSMIAFPVWFLLESGIKISYESLKPPQPPTPQLLPKGYTPDAITKMIQETVREALTEQREEAPEEPPKEETAQTTDDVTVTSTRPESEV